jgi:hypothetical protein
MPCVPYRLYTLSTWHMVLLSPTCCPLPQRYKLVSSVVVAEYLMAVMQVGSDIFWTSRFSTATNHSLDRSLFSVDGCIRFHFFSCGLFLVAARAGVHGSSPGAGQGHVGIGKCRSRQAGCHASADDGPLCVC